MTNLFIAFLLIFLDFNLTINSAYVIGLIPDFVGFIFMIKGLKELAGESPRFSKLRPFAIGMTVYACIVYVLNALAVGTTSTLLSFALSFAETAVSLYISYNIVMGVHDMEIRHSACFNYNNLKTYWTVMAIFQAVAYVGFFIPAFSIVCILVSCAFSIVFLVQFHRSRKLYEAAAFIDWHGGIQQ